MMTMASAMIAGSIVTVAPVAEAAPVLFKDLKSGSFAYDEIMNLTSRGIIGGYQDGTFRPSQAVTRGQSAKLLAETLNLDLTNVKDPKFKDVPRTHPYYAHIAALANKKIISGYKNGDFGANDTLKRSQMAKILAGSFEFELKKVTNTPFKDVKANDQEAKYIQALVDMNVTKGTTATTFSPNGVVTRGQMAIFIYRSDLAKKGTHVSAQVRELKNGNLITSQGTYTVSDSLKRTLFSADNAQALNGAEVSFRLVGGIVSEVHKLELNASGNSSHDVIFDGGSANMSGSLTILGDHLRVKNLTIDEDLILGSKVKNSFVGQNIKVNGTTTVNDTGAAFSSLATIVFQDATLNHLLIDKKASTVILESKSTVKNSRISQNTKLIADEKIKLSNVEVVGAVSEVEINANVTKLEVTSTARLYIAGSGPITNMIVDTPAQVHILSTGKINTLEPSRKSWIYLGNNTSIVNLNVPLGMHASQLIDNFYSVQQYIQQIDGKKNTEYVKPSPPTTTPTKPTSPPATVKTDPTTVMEQITAINKNRSSYITDVRAARAIYDKLSTAQKKSVKNLTVLVEAEATIIANTEQFKEALRNNLDYIILANDITLNEYLKVVSPVEINGNHKLLTLRDQTALTDPNRNSAMVIQANNVKLSNLTFDVAVSKNAPRTQPIYTGVEIDNKTGITLNNITFRNGHVGLYIHATRSDVSISATNITTRDNSLGGIGVTVAPGKIATLTIKADGNTHSPEKPAIRAEGGGDIKVSDPRYIGSANGNEVHFYK
jgi:hypothetical protein